MERDIIKIDEELCNGCGLCIPNCHEGALKVIDGKVRLINELMCDGLGACIGHCPQGAITIENREAKEYDEKVVMEEMVQKGLNTVKAHLMHLKEHNETGYMRQGLDWLMDNRESVGFDVDMLIQSIFSEPIGGGCKSGGCPGSTERVFDKAKPASVTAPNAASTVVSTAATSNVGLAPTVAAPIAATNENPVSELTHWPVQLHLANPLAGHFRGADVVIAADCTAFSYGAFHSDFLKGKKLVIACPKLDSNLDSYREKIFKLIEEAKVNTISVVMMEVPCCGGLLKIVTDSAARATRKVPIKMTIIGLQGEILRDEWI